MFWFTHLLQAITCKTGTVWDLRQDRFCTGFVYHLQMWCEKEERFGQFETYLCKTIALTEIEIVHCLTSSVLDFRILTAIRLQFWLLGYFVRDVGTSETVVFSRESSLWLLDVSNTLNQCKSGIASLESSKLSEAMYDLLLHIWDKNLSLSSHVRVS